MKVFTCHLDELPNRLKNKNIICFGAGGYIDDFLSRFPQSNFQNQIVCFWDNDHNKWGCMKSLGEKQYFIYRPGYFPAINSLDCVIIITTLYYRDILREINKWEDCRKIECYVMEFIKYRYCDNFYADDDLMGDQASCLSYVGNIPKKIHYCWFGKKEMPDQFKKNIETWHYYCPDYEIIRWDENNYNIAVNDYMLKAYETQNWGFVPDYARLDIICQHGGIYLDTDVELLRNLDDLLQYRGFCGFQTDGLVNLGQGFGAQKDMEIIKEMLEQYEDMEFMDLEDSSKITPSPVYQTEILQRHGLKRNNKFQIVDEMAVFPRTYFCPKSLSHGLTEITPDAHTIHHFAASWFGEGKSLYSKECMDVLYETKWGEIYRYEERDKKGSSSLIFG